MWLIHLREQAIAGCDQPKHAQVYLDSANGAMAASHESDFSIGEIIGLSGLVSSLFYDHILTIIGSRNALKPIIILSSFKQFLGKQPRKVATSI